MYCSSTPFSFVKGRFALKPLTNPGVKLFCVQANCPTSCIDTGSCHKCLCFLDINFPEIEPFIDYIQSHQFLLQDRPISLCHGDYHVGNMMIDLKTKELVIIDFGSLEIGDPLEEFNRMIWTAQLSEKFATGLINGYFNGKNIPDVFWKLMAYYMACDVVGSIPWAVNYGNDQLTIMLERAKIVLDWFDNFERVIPKFYKKSKSKKDGNL